MIFKKSFGFLFLVQLYIFQNRHISFIYSIYRRILSDMPPKQKALLYTLIHIYNRAIYYC